MRIPGSARTLTPEILATARVKPEGRKTIAHGVSRWERIHGSIQPRRGGRILSPKIPGVDFHAVLFQEREKLLLEGHLAMMRFLRGDVRWLQESRAADGRGLPGR